MLSTTNEAVACSTKMNLVKSPKRSSGFWAHTKCDRVSHQLAKMFRIFKLSHSDFLTTRGARFL